MNSSAAARFLALPLSNANTGSADTAANQNSRERAEIAGEGLLTGIARGDLDALGLLFQRYERVVRSIAARILRNSAEAEDLVQDLFLFVQRKCSIFDSSKS